MSSSSHICTYYNKLSRYFGRNKGRDAFNPLLVVLQVRVFRICEVFLQLRLLVFKFRTSPDFRLWRNDEMVTFLGSKVCSQIIIFWADFCCQFTQMWICYPWNSLCFHKFAFFKYRWNFHAVYLAARRFFIGIEQ